MILVWYKDIRLLLASFQVQIFPLTTSAMSALLLTIIPSSSGSLPLLKFTLCTLDLNPFVLSLPKHKCLSDGFRSSYNSKFMKCRKFISLRCISHFSYCVLLCCCCLIVTPILLLNQDGLFDSTVLFPGKYK